MSEVSTVVPAITSALCQRCGACCSTVVGGELVACRHLDTADDHRCRIYAERPQVCRDYACVRDGQLKPAVTARVMAAAAGAGEAP